MEFGPNDNTGGWAKALADTQGGNKPPAPPAAAPAPAPVRPTRAVHAAPAGVFKIAR